MPSKTVLLWLMLLTLAVRPVSGHQTPGQDTAPSAGPPRQTVPDEETSRAYFTDLYLLTQAGKQVRFYTDVLKDRVVLINFIYTHCQDACPLLTHKLTQVKDQLGALFGEQVYFVSITTDPVRDSPPVLAQFAEQQQAVHPGWLFLTGAKPDIDTILSKLGQYSPNVEAHSTLLLAGNVRTRHWTKISPITPASEIVLQLQALASES